VIRKQVARPFPSENREIRVRIYQDRVRPDGKKDVCNDMQRRKDETNPERSRLPFEWQTWRNEANNIQNYHRFPIVNSYIQFENIQRALAALQFESSNF
jgi:uncharacterized protein with NAD-binding domain and iron-sulfur cluster